MIFQSRINLTSHGHHDMQDVTTRVQDIVKRSDITVGTAHVFTSGSTVALGTIEFEPGLQQELEQIIISDSNDGFSHLQTTMLGQSITVPVSGGQLVLDTWQQIFFLECDIQSRQRKIVVTVSGD